MFYYSVIYTGGHAVRQTRGRTCPRDKIWLGWRTNVVCPPQCPCLITAIRRGHRSQQPDMAFVLCLTVSAVMSASLNATLVPKAPNVQHRELNHIPVWLSHVDSRLQ